MKNIGYRLSVTLILVFLGTALPAQERIKTINKSYGVSSNVKLSIDNKYGKVHVETWERDEMKIDVTVRADMRSVRRSQDILDKIDIEINGSPSTGSIAFQTSFNGSINSRSGEEFSIDYEVRMPKANSLEVDLSYGNMYLDDLDGDIVIDLGYGNIKGDRLTGKFDIEISYSNGEIDALGFGVLDIKYSNLRIGNVADIDIESQYSDVTLGDARDVDVEMKYGKLRMGSVNNLHVDARYSSISTERINNSLIADLHYGGGITADLISNKFTRVEVEGSYAGSKLNFEAGVNADLEGYFRYCDLKYPDGSIDFSVVDVNNNSREYKGKIGSGGANIKLRSSYGNIRISFD